MALPAPVPAVLVVGVPTDSLFQDTVLGNSYAIPAPPKDGTQAYDITTGTLYIRRAGNWSSVGQADRQRVVAPTDGAITESVSRSTTLADLGATGLFGGATGGTINVVQLPLLPGDIVTNLAFVSGATAANGPTHQWAGIMNSSRVVQAVSADGTSAALAANTEVKFVLGSPFTVTSRGPFYAFVLWTASTAVPSFVGVNQGVVGVSSLTPVYAATSSAGQTTPPAVGATLGALTGVAVAPYVAVS